MSERLFQYYDGLAWIGFFSLEEISDKIRENIITPETWITYSSEPKVKAGDFPGLFTDNYEPEQETASFKTVSMIQSWLQHQDSLSDESTQILNKEAANNYAEFYDLPINLGAFFTGFIVINGLLLAGIGLCSFAYPMLGITFIVGLVQLLVLVWLGNILTNATKSYIRLMKSFQRHLRKQTELLYKIDIKMETSNDIPKPEPT